jgi:hypothetical protein
MIQRIQSIFLFLAAVAAIALYAVPIATTAEVQPASPLFADAAFEVQDGPVMMGTFGVAALMMLVTIFLFRNRILQMNLTKIALFIASVGVGVGAYRFFVDQAMEKAQPALGIALVLLILILGTLAHRAINKDEKLVKSVDRLR